MSKDERSLNEIRKTNILESNIEGTLCKCGHDKSLHTEKRCTHMDLAGNYDCLCAEYFYGGNLSALEAIYDLQTKSKQE